MNPVEEFEYDSFNNTTWQFIVDIIAVHPDEEAPRSHLKTYVESPATIALPRSRLTLAMPFGNMNGMRTELSIDKAGRVVLPQEVRRHFHLVAGDRLDLQILPDGIFLHAQHQKHYLIEEGGLLVHEGEPTGDLTRAVSLGRSARDADVLGLHR